MALLVKLSIVDEGPVTAGQVLQPVIFGFLSNPRVLPGYPGLTRHDVVDWDPPYQLHSIGEIDGQAALGASMDPQYSPRHCSRLSRNTMLCFLLN